MADTRHFLEPIGVEAMKYKAYAARNEYDAHDRIFVGHLVGVRDLVGFHGESVEELETAPGLQ